MKTNLKYAILASLVVFLLGNPSTNAYGKTADITVHLPQRVSRMVEVTVQCLTIPYTREEIATKWDTLMALDISRIADENIPPGVFEMNRVNVQYYADEDSPTSTACFYYASVLMIRY